MKKRIIYRILGIVGFIIAAAVIISVSLGGSIQSNLALKQEGNSSSVVTGDMNTMLATVTDEDGISVVPSGVLLPLVSGDIAISGEGGGIVFPTTATGAELSQGMDNTSDTINLQGHITGGNVTEENPLPGDFGTVDASEENTQNDTPLGIEIIPQKASDFLYGASYELIPASNADEKQVQADLDTVTKALIDKRETLTTPDIESHTQTGPESVVFLLFAALLLTVSWKLVRRA